MPKAVERKASLLQESLQDGEKYSTMNFSVYGLVVSEGSSDFGIQEDIWAGYVETYFTAENTQSSCYEFILCVPCCGFCGKAMFQL